MPDDDSNDPFGELRLDADFVRGATARELTAEERARRARLEAERLAEERAVIDAARRAARPHRRAARALRRMVGAKLVVAVAVLALVASAWWSNREPGSDGAAWSSGRVTSKPVAPDASRPTPRAASSSTPLGRPADAPEPGSYRLVATQPGSAAPVGYDPCRTIQVVVNNRTLPVGGSRLVEDALAQVSRLTGLHFAVEGPTDEAPTTDRAAFQPARYGDRWAPVLMAWSDAAESSDLAGDVAGFAGSSSLEASRGTHVYVTGAVVLDGPDIGELLAEPDGYAVALGIVLHEIGHLVGLDHVDDADELMHPESTDTVTFGPGDRRGLAQLGAGACVPML